MLRPGEHGGEASSGQDLTKATIGLPGTHASRARAHRPGARPHYEPRPAFGPPSR